MKNEIGAIFLLSYVFSISKIKYGRSIRSKIIKISYENGHWSEAIRAFNEHLTKIAILYRHHQETHFIRHFVNSPDGLVYFACFAVISRRISIHSHPLI